MIQIEVFFIETTYNTTAYELKEKDNMSYKRFNNDI